MFPGFRKRIELCSGTLQLVERLFSSSWFAEVGKPVSQEVDAYVVKNWAEAVDLIENSDQLLLQIRGDYTARLQKIAPRRDRQWNQLAIRIKQIVEPKIDQKLAAIDQLVEVQKDVVRNATRWTILSACLESEYSDVMPPGFFLSFAGWYVEGRFPCGWKGDYPQGQVAIY